MTRPIALAALLLVACGNDELVTIVPDAIHGVDSGPHGCNAVAQTACLANEKCTWIDGAPECVTDGTIAVGDPCTADAVGDDCARAICHEGICRRFCTLSPDSCDAPETCVDHPEAPTYLDFGVCVGP